jgi:hypothetical protein
VIEGSTKRRFYAVLHVPSISSPADAVRAAIVEEFAVANSEERIAEDQRKREFDLAVDALKLEVTLFWQ